MEPVTALFGAACIGALLLAQRGSDADAPILAWMLLQIWAVANILWLFDAMEMLAFFDLPTALLSYVVWFERQDRWIACLAAIMAARLGLHLGYRGPGSTGEVAYFHLINGMFLAALAAVSWKGGIGDVWKRIGSLCDLRRVRSVVA